MSVLPFVTRRTRELEAYVQRAHEENLAYASSPPASAGYHQAAGIPIGPISPIGGVDRGLDLRDRLQIGSWLRAEGLLALSESLVAHPLPAIFLTDDWREARRVDEPHGLTYLSTAPASVGRTIHIRLPERYRPSEPEPA